MTADRPVRMSIEDTLAAILDQLQQSNTLMGLVLGEGQSGNASSIQIEDAAKGPPRVTTKVYAGSAPDVEGAIEAHARAHRLAEQGYIDQWKETLDVIRQENEQPRHRDIDEITLEEVVKRGEANMAKYHPSIPLGDA